MSIKRNNNLGEMIDCRSGSGNVIQVKPGTFPYTKEQGSNQNYLSCVRRTQRPTCLSPFESPSHGLHHLRSLWLLWTEELPVWNTWDFPNVIWFTLPRVCDAQDRAVHRYPETLLTDASLVFHVSGIPYEERLVTKLRVHEWPIILGPLDKLSCQHLP